MNQKVTLQNCLHLLCSKIEKKKRERGGELGRKTLSIHASLSLLIEPKAENSAEYLRNDLLILHKNQPKVK